MATTKRTRRSAYTPNARTRVARARNREWILAKVPDELRQQVDRWANDWLRTKFGRLLELRAADPGPFNYPIEVFSEWRGKAFYLCVRYRTGKGRPQGDFIVRSARLTMTGFGRFDLAYFRHTERWFTVYRGLTATECFREIEGNGVFWPVM